MDAFGRNGPVVSVWSGDVGLVCGMKRGIFSVAIVACGFVSVNLTCEKFLYAFKRVHAPLRWLSQQI